MNNDKIDMFAAAVLTGILARSGMVYTHERERVIAAAFDIAQAMCEESERRNKE